VLHILWKIVSQFTRALAITKDTRHIELCRGKHCLLPSEVEGEEEIFSFVVHQSVLDKTRTLGDKGRWDFIFSLQEEILGRRNVITL